MEIKKYGKEKVGLQEPTLFKLLLVTEQGIGSINPCSCSATLEHWMEQDNPRDQHETFVEK